jgi:phage-related protein
MAWGGGADQQVYQLVLQLKDEVTAALKQTNAALNGTKATAKVAQNGIESISSTMKGALNPIRQFTVMFRKVMALGGAAYIFNRVVRAVGEMEKAYAKVNPEINKIVGSSYQLNAALEANAAAFGKVSSALFSPARAEFQAVIQQAAKDAGQLGNNLDRAGEVLGNVARYGIKSFQTLGMVFVDGYKLFAMMLKLMWELTKAVAESIWVPLKNAFLLIIQPIKQAFVDVINFCMKGVQFLVNKIGDAMSFLTGGAMGKGFQSWAPTMMTAGDVTPTDDKGVISAWSNIWSKFISSSKEVGAALTDMGSRYVEVWTKTNEATAYEVKTKEEQKKVLLDLKKDWKSLRGLRTVLPGVGGQAGIGTPQNVTMGYMSIWGDMHRELKDGFDGLDEWREKWQQSIKDARLGHFSQAQGFLTNPLAEIGNIAQTAGQGAAAGGGGLGAMIASFFALFAEGIGALIVSLAAMAPLVLLIMAVMEVFKGIFDILGPVIDSMLKPILDVLKLLGNALGTLLLPIFQALEPVISAICSVLQVFMPLFQLLEPIFKALGFVLKLLMMPVIAMMIAVVAVLNLVIDGLNWAFGWLGVSLSRMALPAMPTFHEGGVAEDEMVALLKKGEIVMNPYKSQAYVAGGNQVGGVTINAPNARYLDANTAAELVRMGLVAMRA